MAKRVVINEILDLYDENERLKNELARYKETNPIICAKVDLDNTKANIFKDLESKAKSCLIDKVFYYYPLEYSNIEVKENDNEINFLTFEQWIKSLKNENRILNSNYQYLLDSLTLKEIFEYFKPALEDYFNNRVNNRKMEILRNKKEEKQ